MSWKITRKKKKGIPGGFNHIELRIDNKKVIDSEFGYVNCNEVNFDSKTKTIMLS